MIFSEIMLSYPYIKYKIEISHFTARKSTAVEWLILEAIDKCESDENYKGVSIDALFNGVFTISDANLLILPCIISLQDMGAITISNIDDETKLDSVAMRELKLTNTGREMQKKGLLPGATSEEVMTLYYDVLTRNIFQGDKGNYTINPSGIQVENVERSEFPLSLIKTWLSNIQNNKEKTKLNWLSPTTNIQDISELENTVLWKNSIKKVEIVDGMRWKILGAENEKIDDLTLMAFDSSLSEEISNLPHLNISNPDNEIKMLMPIAKLSTSINENIQKDNFFIIDEKYYRDIKTIQNNKKSLKIGIVYGAESFSVENKNKCIIVRIPDCEFREKGWAYLNAQLLIQVGLIKLFTKNVSKDIVAVACIPKTATTNLSDIVVPIIKQYYKNDNSILLLFYEFGLKNLFLEYVAKLLSNENKLNDKARIIDEFNEKSKSYYGSNIISVFDKERFLIDETYIKEHCKDIKGLKNIIDEYSNIKSIFQEEKLFKKMLALTIKSVGRQDDIESIWELWEYISSKDKTYLKWISEENLYKDIYSINSISSFLKKTMKNTILEIKEYTKVEKIVIQMRDIALRIENMLHGFNIFELVSEEKYNKIILNNKNVLNNLYELVKQWKDREKEFSENIIAIDDVLQSSISFEKLKTNIEGLKKTLATFFDDSFMKFDKIYIVDTSALMKFPSLISKFENRRALLVIPLIVLQELDKLKTDDEKGIMAREVIRNIEKYKMCEWLNIKEKSHPELLLDDLDKNRNDNKILSIAIKYLAKKPILLTDDINMRNIATAASIETINLNTLNSGQRNLKKQKK